MKFVAHVVLLAFIIIGHEFVALCTCIDVAIYIYAENTPSVSSCSSVHQRGQEAIVDLLFIDGIALLEY